MPLTAEKIKVQLKRGSKGRYSIKVDKVVGWIPTAGQQVVWTCNNADLKVEFDKNGSPFTAAAFYGPKGTTLCATGEPINTTKQAYGYTLTITPNPQIANGSVGLMAPITFDPQVVVDDDGPPGGGARKKSARKKAAKRKSAKKRARRRR